MKSGTATCTSSTGVRRIGNRDGQTFLNNQKTASQLEKETIMSHEKSFLKGPMLPSVLAGAALGALVVALTTPKTGPELRSDLMGLAGRAKRKAADLADDAYESMDSMRERTVLAVGELKQSMSDAADDLRA
jgi:gas vesicle protein